MSAVANYLLGVPGGVGGHPEAQTRVAVLQAFVSPQELATLPVPDEVRARVAGVHAPSAWVPEVHAQCFYLAQREAHFDDDDDYVDYARARNAALLDSRLSRTVFRLLRQSGTARMWARSWARHHVGTTLEVNPVEPGLLEARIVMPTRLIPPLIARCTITALEVALLHGGAEEAVAELVDQTDTLIRFRTRYR